MKEEIMGSNNDLCQIVKGRRRSKRYRPSSPQKVTTMTSGIISGCGDDDSGDLDVGHAIGGYVGEDYGSTSPATTSNIEEICHENTEEEEDMANCLILLAQGDGPRQVNETNDINSVDDHVATKSKKLHEIAISSIHKAGFYVYECKTCNRSFPSFQALGGHRASHKKPKTSISSPIEDKKSIDSPTLGIGHYNFFLGYNTNQENCQLNKSSTTSTASTSTSVDNFLSLQIAPTTATAATSFADGQKGINKKSKIHECSICGAEFISGQALGGHMRRHRQPNTTQVNVNMEIELHSNNINKNKNIVVGGELIKQRNILPNLDLNLPAPEDDHHHRESKFQFVVSSQPPLVFSAAPTLIDCHY